MIPEHIIDQIRAASMFDRINNVTTLHKAGSVWKGLCPFHTEKTPSFTYNEKRNRYKCFGCPASGDIFDWMKETQGLEFVDAAKLLASEMGLAFEDYYHEKPAFEARRRIMHDPRELPKLPDLNKGTDEDHEALAKLRGLQVETIKEAVERRFLGFCDYGYRAESATKYGGIRYWVITDKTGVNAQLRRLDGQTMGYAASPMKAQTFKGAWASWPIGAANITKNVVIHAEGGPDFLAALELCMNGLDADPSASLGATMPIHDTALPFYKNKTVLFAAHNDPPGLDAVGRWSTQLKGSVTATITMPEQGEDLNDFLCRVGVKSVIDYFKTCVLNG